MKNICLLKNCLLILILANVFTGYAAEHPKSTLKNVEKVFNIKEYGAIGDGKTMNTAAIDKAITACANAGGGTVLIPNGNFITGTIVLKSNITLYLEQDAHVIGTTDISEYKSFKLRPEDPLRPINITVKDSLVWCRALVLIEGVHDVAIAGTGTIDGSGVIDKRGEEGRRGPHGILMGEARNITISNIRVTRSGNYNILGLGVENVRISGVTVTQGADGIHIRRGKNLVIENCKCYTADDAIAGGYWENMLIKDCLLNSSCNGIRVILPATNLEIANCEIFGPGVFGHPRGTADNPLVTRTLTGIIVQPGAWGLGAGYLDRINIHDIRIRDMQTAITFVLNEGNKGRNIMVTNLMATGITNNAGSVEAWPKGSSYENVKFKNINIAYSIIDKALLKTKEIKRPGTESLPRPYWGFYVRNVKDISFENVKLTYAGTDERPVMGFDSVGKVLLSNIKYKSAGNGRAFKYNNSTIVTQVNTAPIK